MNKILSKYMSNEIWQGFEKNVWLSPARLNVAHSIHNKSQWAMNGANAFQVPYKEQIQLGGNNRALLLHI